MLAALLICNVNNSGNWGVDLQAGSQFGYRLLFVVLLSGLFAVLLQVRPIPPRIRRHTMLMRMSLNY